MNTCMQPTPPSHILFLQHIKLITIFIYVHISVWVWWNAIFFLLVGGGAAEGTSFAVVFK
jgi:hypothetical protein